MKDASFLILQTCIQKLKTNSHAFGKIEYAIAYGDNCAVSDVVTHISGKKGVYRIMVVKHPKE